MGYKLPSNLQLGIGSPVASNAELEQRMFILETKMNAMADGVLALMNVVMQGAEAEKALEEGLTGGGENEILIEKEGASNGDGT